ncbi:hypothetical protein DESC_480221 [Desulfosarcina cetonica]|nr:hypothetical protein DESC_480221 [Desulfosarcina cetonica]
MFSRIWMSSERVIRQLISLAMVAGVLSSIGPLASYGLQDTVCPLASSRPLPKRIVTRRTGGRKTHAGSRGGVCPNAELPPELFGF